VEHLIVALLARGSSRRLAISYDNPA